MQTMTKMKRKTRTSIIMYVILEKILTSFYNIQFRVCEQLLQLKCYIRARSVGHPDPAFCLIKTLILSKFNLQRRSLLQACNVRGTVLAQALDVSKSYKAFLYSLCQFLSYFCTNEAFKRKRKKKYSQKYEFVISTAYLMIIGPVCRHISPI